MRRGTGISSATFFARLCLLLIALATTLAMLSLPAASSAATIQVEVSDNIFSPQEIRVKPGDRVVWKNVGIRIHTVTADKRGFDSGNLAPGETFAHTFRKEGFYFYHCIHHGAPKAGMWGVVVVGRPSTGSKRKITVPGDYRTITRAVQKAPPGSTITINPGRYRESVVIRTPNLTIKGADRFRSVLHGQDAKANGITVQGVRGVTIKGLTIRNYRGSGILLNRATSYTVVGVDLIKNRTYGVNAVRSHDGVIKDSFGWGSGDSAFRVAFCSSCSTIVDSVQASRNFIGYSGTNSSGVVILRSRFENNGAGIASLMMPAEEGPSSMGTHALGNTVSSNNYSSVPASGISKAYGIPFGTGIWLAGVKNNTVQSNKIKNHRRYGVLVTGSFDGHVPAVNNAVIANWIRSSGKYALAWDGTGSDNCFERNDFLGSTGPPDIQQHYACDKKPFVGTRFEPVAAEVSSAIASGSSRKQAEPREPIRPRCQKGRPRCKR